MRMVTMGKVEPFDDQMIEADMDVHAHELNQPPGALSTMADSLPGLGIAAAVLGVVMTMSALGGHPEDRQESCRSAGRDVSRHPVVLRICSPAGRQYGQAGRRGA